MLMIGLHEGGHLVFAKFFGLKTGGFYFLPGLGGISLTSEPAKKRWIDFWVWFGGPFVGALLVLALCAVLAVFGPKWSVEYRVTAIYVVFIWSFINLFNLFPIFPLDGGGMLWSIVKSFWKGFSPWGAITVNILAIAGFYALTRSIVWTILLAAMGCWQAWTAHKFELSFHKEDLKWWQVVVCFLSYVVLAFFFLVFTGWSAYMLQLLAK